MTHRSPTLAAALVALVLAVPTTGAWAKNDKNKTPAPTAAPAPDKPYADWKKTIKDAEVKKGWFTLYRKRESLYLEIRSDQLDQPVLGVFSFARGIGQNGLLGGLPLDDILITFHRAGDHILVIQKNTRFTAPTGSPMERAKDLSIGESVLASLKIESEQDSTHALLVDFANFVVSDVSDLGEDMRGALGNKPVRFDKDRSALTSVKVFPENFEIETLLTYTPNDRTGLGLETVPDERYIPLSVHYSFSKLPDDPMPPRLADDRVGYFLTVKKDFGRDQNESFFVRYVNRWRLEKMDPTAAVSEVKKPIVYYIDKTVPAEYRPYVKKGIENWQKAFEAAGLKNAIVARDAPDDSTWDPEDVRYSTIRWITSSVPSFGAIGPSRIDPRTGEILDADILFEASFLQGFRNTYRRWSGPDAMAEAIFPSLVGGPSWLPLEQRCDAGLGLMDGGSLMNVALHMDGTLPPGEPVPIEWIGDCLTWAVMHEVGHTLGLRHNFRSSTSTPMDKLDDAAWTKEHGLYSSVMDYPTPNVAVDHAKQGEYFSSTAGTEDIWAIRYGYTPSGSADPDQDHAFAAKIANESLEPGHEYSTDEDTYPADALDPRTNIYDLGSDPLMFAKERTSYLARLWRDPKFEERIVGADGELATLRRAMDNLLVQYGIALGHAVKYIGGQSVSR
ncbi:MAG: zinc-dependent metalloprotease, partial [Candidatus Eisenbacteria bacterium]